MWTPSVVAMPTRWPASFRMCPTMRVVVVLPLVPVIAATGMRAAEARGKSMSRMAPATSRGRPSEGARCMRRPGRR